MESLLFFKKTGSQILNLEILIFSVKTRFFLPALSLSNGLLAQKCGFFCVDTPHFQRNFKDAFIVILR
jgi:hypothetical protein